MISSSSAVTAASHAPNLHISTTTTTTVASPSTHHNNLGSPSPRGGSSSSTGGGNNGSTNQACAACKYQRRKCNPDCPLAPYFPADQQRRFLNAHRLFGVSNILKTLRRLRPELCAEAMGSLIFQAEVRAHDPVGGCYRIILGLERQLDMEQAELAAVLHHLAMCRHQAAAANSAMPASGGMADLDVTSSCNQQAVLLNNADQEVDVDAMYANHHQEVLQNEDHPQDQGGHSPQHHVEQQQLFDYFYYDTTNTDDNASRGKPPVTLDINVDAMHQFVYDNDQKVHMVAPEALHEDLAITGQEQNQLDVNCDIDDHKDYDVKSALLVDMFDMRLPVVDGNDDKVEGVNGNIDINAVDVNAQVDLNEELQETDTKNNIALCEEPQLATVDSSQCRLGLAFSAL